MPAKAIFKASRVANAELTAWLEDHAVVVEDGRIASVLPQASLADSSSEAHRVYDLGDVSLLPGLVDAHCHMHCSATEDAPELILSEDVSRFLMRSTIAMRKALVAGTTTVRDLGAKNEVAFPIRDAIHAGAIPGPRLICSGAAITLTAGHCWFFGIEADTPREVMVALQRQARLGAGVIKIMATGGMFTTTSNPRGTQYPAEVLAGAVEEAERFGLPVAAHALSAAGVRNCAEAGVHHLIHARWLSADPDKGLEYDPRVTDQIVEKGLWVDPTIGHILLGEEERERMGAPPTAPHSMVSANTPTVEDHLETIREMDRAGVRFMAGLDMGMQHAGHDRSAANAWAFHDWLGWDEWRAIRTCTAVTAEAPGIEDTVGALRPGLAADMAAFRGNPARSIRDLDVADSVIQAGRPVKLHGEALV